MTRTKSPQPKQEIFPKAKEDAELEIQKGVDDDSRSDEESNSSKFTRSQRIGKTIRDKVSEDLVQELLLKLRNRQEQELKGNERTSKKVEEECERNKNVGLSTEIDPYLNSFLMNSLSSASNLLVKLENKSEYKQWKQQLKLTFTGQGLANILETGGEKGLTEGIRSMREVQVLSVILSKLGSRMYSYVKECKTPSEVIRKLDSLYTVKTDLTASNELHFWTGMRLGGNQKVREFLVKFEDKITKLKNNGIVITNKMMVCTLFNAMPTTFQRGMQLMTTPRKEEESEITYEDLK